MLIRSALVCAVAMLAAGQTPKQEKREVIRAAGTFDVKVTPLEAGKGGLVRLALDKRFHGPLEAVSVGEMLASGSGRDPSGGYVAMERVTGKLNGREGTFVLQHSGTMSPESMQITVVVSPGSGTGELTGISGALVIRIEGKQHFYDLDYSLPAAAAN